LAAMQSGATYVNVHTANNKPGEVRGQIEKRG
jgi:CHRD domain